MRLHLRSSGIKICLQSLGSAAIAFTLANGSASLAHADVCGSITGNAIQNCGFESGDFTGWTLSGNLQGGAPPNNYYGVDSAFPNSGRYEGYFGVQGGGGSAIGSLGPFLALSQTLNLKPAQNYSLGFYLDQNAPSRIPGYVNHFDFSFGGPEIFSETNAPNSGGAYKNYTFTLATSSDPAAAANTQLLFHFQNDSDYFYLDDVYLTAAGSVPEPANILLVSPMIAGLYLWRRKRISY